ncbi:hypothetical protein [Pontibacter actiniarum]|uniref:Uncharacterized protein n=1 Tax=Pontibacter actiniarum TaxID=323450 RepID=A0A1X9YYL2_9BACT|nr:hypothetical protein [Pontibacter actiniarum]ARS37978.1 hypothetical protein CA264_20535 [Pontibacter actiniarum]
MQQTLQQTFNRIVGLPLTKTTRTETVQYFHFGHTHYTTPQGLVLDVGEITLAVNCPWQLQQPAGEAIKHSEVFIRKREAGLPTPVWDWKKPGSSLLDQRMANLINNNPNLVVERAEQQGELGLMLYFSDGTTISVMPDPAQPAAEYWQFFSNTGDGLKVGAGEGGIA